MSKSSLNPSVTDVIQNFLNLSLNACSLFATFPAEAVEGIKDGIAVRGGGECERCLDEVLKCSARAGRDDLRVAWGRYVGFTEESELESESDSADEDSDLGSSSIGVLAGLLAGETSSPDEDDESDEEDSETARLFLFLLRFLATGLAGAGAMMFKIRKSSTHPIEA